MLNEEMRGKLVNESTLKLANGESQSLPFSADPSKIGKDVVIRTVNGQQVVNERIDS